MEPAAGPALALLLLHGFRSMVDDVTTELTSRGHPGVRAADEFALRAVDTGAGTASELGRRLGVSKQAAAQRITALEQLGYIGRSPDPQDARRKRLTVTARGHDMMTIGAGALDQVRARWADQIGAAELAALEAHLTRLTAGTPLPADET